MGATTLVVSSHNVVTESHDGEAIIVYNGFTGATVVLDRPQQAFAHFLRRGGNPCPLSLPDELMLQLERAGCLVPPGFNQVEAIRSLRESPTRRHPLLLSIAPTLRCNFRCPYCFEAHKNERMGPEVEAALRNFLSQQLRSDPQMSLMWYGGEPLLEIDVIQRTHQFIDAEFPMSSGARFSILTNGYLLSLSVVDRLMDVAKWTYVQVTIDGPEAAHNNRRVLAGGQSTWDRIVSNVLGARSRGLPVVLRMNIDTTNQHLVSETIDSFLDAGLLPETPLYLAPIRANTEACAHAKDFELGSREMARVQLRFDAEMMRRGLRSHRTVPTPRNCGTICSVDSDRGFVVSPAGYLFKCTKQVELAPEFAVGHLLGLPVPNAERATAIWHDYDPLSPSQCQTCFALASCMGGCPWNSIDRKQRQTGECGPLRHFPGEVLKIAYVEDCVQRAKGSSEVGVEGDMEDQRDNAAVDSRRPAG